MAITIAIAAAGAAMAGSEKELRIGGFLREYLQVSKKSSIFAAEIRQ